MNANVGHVVMVVYDGIENSVFESQVLAPILLELEAEVQLECTIVSFEYSLPTRTTLIKKFPAHDRLHLVIARKLPFFGMPSLWFALWQLTKIFKLIGGSELRARGPLAGWLLLRVIEKYLASRLITAHNIPPITIQARGLAAQEYRYVAQRSKRRGLMWVKDWLTQRSLERLEATVYGYQGVSAKCGQLTIEAVSEALRDYLITTFKTKAITITLATKDITPLVDSQQACTWRAMKRRDLGIAQSAFVYVYSGSFKPWQCAEQTVAQAAVILRQEANAFFLVLTTDVEPFKQAINEQGIDRNRYRVLCTSPGELMQYLVAADVGLLLREHDIINWVSRPTKMLEYQAAGLKIIHNDTVACLAK